MTPLITARMTGGLGNQMFVYAAALGLAARTGAHLVIDPCRVNDFRRHMLDRLQVPQDLVAPPEARRRHGLPGALSALGQRITRGPSPIFREAGFAFDPRFEALQAPVTLEGYFQSWRYFVSVQDEVRERFRLRDPLSRLSQQYAGRIAAARLPVSVHVRRGDYLLPQNGMYGVVTLDYYRRAKRLMDEKFNDVHYFVFSDDTEWCQENLGNDFGKVTLVAGTGDTPWEDLHLMSLCAHHIIANSSFSWWGAWLNPSTEKMVITPKNWFGRGTAKALNERDLRPLDWLTL